MLVVSGPGDDDSAPVVIGPGDHESVPVFIPPGDDDSVPVVSYDRETQTAHLFHVDSAGKEIAGTRQDLSLIHI